MDRTVKRWWGLRIMVWSVVLAVASAAPILLYALVGPADGNPVGLGLLLVIGVPLGVIGLALGAATAAVEFAVRRRS